MSDLVRTKTIAGSVGVLTDNPNIKYNSMGKPSYEAPRI